MFWITGVLCAGLALYLVVSEPTGNPNGTSSLPAGQYRGEQLSTTTVSTKRNSQKKSDRRTKPSPRPTQVGMADPRRRATNKDRVSAYPAEMASNSSAPALGSAPYDEPVKSANIAANPEKTGKSNPQAASLDGRITVGPQEISGPLPLAVSLTSIRPEVLSPEERRFIEAADNSFRNAVEEETRLSVKNADAAARYRTQAVSLHDEYLRITLGWDRFNALSAEAARWSRSNQSVAPNSVSEFLNQ